MSAAKGFSDKTVALIRARDDDRCAWCNRKIRGERGVDWSVHHRRARGSGGTSLAWVNLPGNGVLLCGSGTTLCHGLIESQRAGAVEDGFLVSMNGKAVSSDVEILHAVHGRCLLGDDGTVTK